MRSCASEPKPLFIGFCTIDAKSILSVMTLAAKCDIELTVTADGPGEAAAMESMVSLIESGFGEEE